VLLLSRSRTLLRHEAHVRPELKAESRTAAEIYLGDNSGTL